MASQLSDLDELVLKCRDEEAKSYVREAVACYKSGAIRSCIVATWVAVAYDLLGKFRDLSLTGDKEAEKQIDRFDKARASGNISEALKIERDILKIARNKFELITPLELTDLNRLQDDRNRCAHPSMVSSSEPFQPTAELARYHLSNAVEHLLQRKPVQGKSALNRLVDDVDSEYFPIKNDKAFKHLKHSPLANPRTSLIRNFLMILLKKMIYNDLSIQEMKRYATALNATRKMHREVTESVLETELSELLRTVKSKNTFSIILLLVHLSDIWHFIDEDIQGIAKRYILNMDGQGIYYLTDLITIDGIEKEVTDRIRRLTTEEAFDSTFLDNHHLLNDRRIELYTNSGSYHTANYIGNELFPYIKDFKAEQVEYLLVGAAQNSQVVGSYELKTVINVIKEDNPISDEELNDLLERYDLSDYID